MHCPAPLKIGKSKSALSIAAIGCTKKRKERGVLTDWQYLPVAKRPALGCEVEGENSNFCYKWISHDFSPLVLGRENSCQRDAKVEHKIRRTILVGLTAAGIGNG